MAKKKSKKKVKQPEYIYKGYDMRWLKQMGEEHPDYKLVAEYEAKKGK